MKKSVPLFALLIMVALTSESQTKVGQLLCENKVDPVGIDMIKPSLSWQLTSGGRNIMQTAYEILVATDAASLKSGKGSTWSSGKVASSQSVYIPYSGKALESGKKYYWQVRVWDNSGQA